MASAFQRNAFQDNAFQIDDLVEVEPVDVEQLAAQAALDSFLDGTNVYPFRDWYLSVYRRKMY